jgi:hypothetical protein
MSRAEREEFLAGVHVGIVSVDEPGEGPLSVPVWYLYEPAGEIVLVTRPQARKAPLLRVGARVSFLVQSEEMPPKYVSIQGTVTSAEPADVARDLKPVVRNSAPAHRRAYVVAPGPTAPTSHRAHPLPALVLPALPPGIRVIPGSGFGGPRTRPKPR